MTKVPFPAVLVGLAAAWMTSAGPSIAQGDEKIITAHGYNEYDELKYGPDAQNLDYVNPDAPEGGEISISAIGTFDSMNPYATGIGNWGALSTIGFEDIMQTTDDEIGSYYCVLCETIEYPESRDWVIFNLRDDVTFSDGTPMTAEDIKFTLDLLLEQGTPSYRAGVGEMIDTVEVLDPHRIKFTFAADYPRKGLITQFGSLSPFSKKWYEETGARLDESRLEISPGTGEYMLDSLDAGRQIIYKRNPDYWGRDHWFMKGRGNYDSIRVEYFGDTSAAFEAFKAGVYTFRAENSSLNWATLYDFPAVQKGWVKKEELPDGNLPNASGFVFNMRGDKFADRNVRLALGRMFNFTWTNDNLQYGLFQQRESFWENERLKATGLPEGDELAILEEFREQLPPEIFTEPAVLPHESGDRPLDRRNLRAALGLMAEAGYTPGADGLLRDAEGKTLDVELLEDTQSFDRILLPYVENLKALGVNITYNRVDPAQYQTRRQANDFDMRFDGYSVGLVEGSGLEQKFGCEDKDDIFNAAGYCNPVVDTLAKRLLEVETYDEMSALVRAIDRIMRYDYFIVPTWMLQENWVAYYDMYEYPENLPEFGLGYLDYWWIDEEKAAALRSAGALR
ncbi:ABC transporter substrate-binding protein [Silicimonas algicola]|uniref:Microcin C transport system substrate-binding protein n=1 Tax=Silicimonas algicola TaxID=1826607 RepID=A0A316G437_9RHOB|nr:extracellular solute-binding protein [Silicimonas algicola]AZQ68579.1 ABC transporter substrate-binding protein [Silicimonas algicola]PWK55704.1 microcin C transport system substrate-binding protein [Silicimonas algicola]